MTTRLRDRVHDILELTSPEDHAGRSFNVFMMVLISINVVVVMLETVGSLASEYADWFRWLELASVAVFTVEYVTRLFVCTSDPRYRRPVVGRIQYALTFLALMDLIAILPFYLPMLIPLDLRILRAVRLLRVCRLFKLGRYSHALAQIAGVFKRKREELSISVFAVLILLVLVSSSVYYVEHPVQPEVFSSIPATMWWGITTLTTVGYGDTYPITDLGKVFGAVSASLGIGLFALPTGILASGFAEAIRKKEVIRCPHCGKEI